MATNFGLVSFKEVIQMTINLFFITLSLTISKRVQSKEKYERNLEVQERMEQSKDYLFRNGNM